MRTSCNGCRVLRKGCSEDCAIRPSVEWIKSPDSQANATVFLAKFYGRAGLLNLLSAAPPNLRPAIFKSLLYEACGRIVDPVYGSAGLMWSGQWHHCQAAVDAVLKGLPIHQLQGPTPMPPPPADNVHVIIPPPSLRDIRHVSSKTNGPGPAAHSDDLISMFSTETVEPTVSDRADPDSVDPDAGLELTLGFGRGL